MDTKQIVESLDLIPNVKERFRRQFDSLNAQQRLSVERLVWRAWGAMEEVRMLEYVYIESLRNHIPPGTRIGGVTELLQNVSPEVVSRIINKAEEDVEKYPG